MFKYQSLSCIVKGYIRKNRRKAGQVADFSSHGHISVSGPRRLLSNRAEMGFSWGFTSIRVVVSISQDSSVSCWTSSR